MVKWEYLGVRVSDKTLTGDLKQYGLEGWELVQLLPTSTTELTNWTAVFKRPLIQIGVAQGVR